jgi:hypothetical protein
MLKTISPISRLTAAGALGISIVATGCADPQIDLETTSANVAANAIWTIDKIPVCWEYELSSQDWHREVVRQAVEDGWAAAADIEFIGWGECETAFDPGIHISSKTDSDYAGWVKALGKNLDGMQGGMMLRLNTTDEAAIRRTALHEFGHALGFAHEEIRSDKPDSCQELFSHFDGDFVIGPWDADSIMNRCNGSVTELSALDKYAAALVYGDGGFQGKRIKSKSSKDCIRPEALDEG